jgi:2-polyprenyl-6-methoxyphenol hydroxylase-like FAD-dependent oxidoreductase
VPPNPITVIGGGLAGLTLGIGLRRHGIPVTIREAGSYPRHRVCGEFISGRGHETLARLGLREKLIEAGAITATTAMFLSGKAKSPARPLPKPALCVSRFVLDALLANIFRELGGELRENDRWREETFAEGVVRASGRRAQPTDNGWHWYGLKIHARNLPLQADLEMHIVDNGYIGLTRLPNNEVDVCGLFRRSSGSDNNGDRGAVGTPRPTLPRMVGRGVPTAPRNASAEPSCNDSNLPRAWPEALRQRPSNELFTRLTKATLDETSSCSVAGLSLQPRRATTQTELSIGDSLTMTPPVTGNGMSMAFESAELALEPLVAYSRGQLDWSRVKQAVAEACDRAFARRLAWARWLQWMMFSPLFKGPMAAVALRSGWLWQTMFTNTR